MNRKIARASMVLHLSLLMGGCSCWRTGDRHPSCAAMRRNARRSYVLAGGPVGRLTTITKGAVAALAVELQEGLTPAERDTLWSQPFLRVQEWIRASSKEGPNGTS